MTTSSTWSKRTGSNSWPSCRLIQMGRPVEMSRSAPVWPFPAVARRSRRSVPGMRNDPTDLRTPRESAFQIIRPSRTSKSDSDGSSGASCFPRPRTAKGVPAKSSTSAALDFLPGRIRHATVPESGATPRISWSVPTRKFPEGDALNQSMRRSSCRVQIGGVAAREPGSRVGRVRTTRSDQTVLRRHTVALMTDLLSASCVPIGLNEGNAKESKRDRCSPSLGGPLRFDQIMEWKLKSPRGLPRGPGL